MSSQAEDIIRETFSSLAKAIGVQIDIPDEMIANLAATLQAQIDLLAELQSTGRLLGDDEMRLTAEQVENVRAAREELRGYRNFDGNARGRVNRLTAAVDALFPATEPAEVISRYQTMQRGFAAKHFGFPANPVFEDRYTAPDGGKWQWTDELQWELRCYPPAPAVPAGEATKAEHNASVARREALGRVAQQLYEQSFDGCDGTFYHDFGRALEDFLPSQGWVRNPASSPVVPAPTETEWQRIEDVPVGVLQIKDRHGRRWLMVGGTWRFEWHDGNWYEPHTNINAQAPFVAAEEG